MSVNKISFQNVVSKKYEMINSCTKLEPIQTKQKIYKNYLVIEIIINLKIRTKGSNARWSFFFVVNLLFFCSYLFLFCRNNLQLYILSLWITIATAILYSIFSFRIKSKTSPSYKGATWCCLATPGWKNIAIFINQAGHYVTPSFQGQKWRCLWISIVIHTSTWNVYLGNNIV